jgi:L-alanine-DL-glutamate epimerase-like enolase superfamily enzyme
MYTDMWEEISRGIAVPTNTGEDIYLLDGFRELIDRRAVDLVHHSVDTAWWEHLVTGVEKPIVEDGSVTVPEQPGIGVELNEAVVKEHLADGAGYFEPTPEWNEKQSWDRTWS